MGGLYEWERRWTESGIAKCVNGVTERAPQEVRLHGLFKMKSLGRTCG